MLRQLAGEGENFVQAVSFPCTRQAYSRLALSASRYSVAAGWRRRMLAGQAVRMSPSSVSRTARALVACGHHTEHLGSVHQCGHCQRQRMGGHVVQSGEAAVMHLLVAAYLVQRHGFTRAGSSKSATGGSLKAMCPFSPMPMQVMSTGKRRSSWE